MSDNSYSSANGKNYRVSRGANGTYEANEGEGRQSSEKILAERAAIDHQAQRLIWERPEGRHLFWIYSIRNKRVLSWPGGSIELEAHDIGDSQSGTTNNLKPLKLTMPGKVLSVNVLVGDIVEAGQGLLIVEAMKMENLILAAARAKVAKVHVQAGDRLESGTILVSFESA